MSTNEDTSCEPSGAKKKSKFRVILHGAFSVAKGLFLVYKIWRKVYEFLTDL